MTSNHLVPWIHTGSIFVTVLIKSEGTDSVFIYLQLAFSEGIEILMVNNQGRNAIKYRALVKKGGKDTSTGAKPSSGMDSPGYLHEETIAQSSTDPYFRSVSGQCIVLIDGVYLQFP